jgi:hypothetical protein
MEPFEIAPEWRRRLAEIESRFEGEWEEHFGRIRDWKGGHVRVYSLLTGMRASTVGGTTYEAYAERKLEFEGEALAVGDGYAVLQPLEVELQPGLVVEFGVREGRGGVVAIRSKADGPLLTHTVLRELGPLGKSLADAVAQHSLLVLYIDADGVAEAIPVQAMGDAVAGLLKAETVDEERRPGRPRVSDDELRRAADAYQRARHEGRATAQTVAETLGVTLDVAKKRIRRARERGLLPPTHAHKDRANV